ncbi:hypothetical protein [Bradyrhizobium sp. SZCCHNR1093]|uniref:hypothetical protein n=1 Tax=Bradyrhizobium sp. SZCCHNR1093 TaxID=3057368 RepID=UPI0028E34E6B|nr:hypothetical protein [Bradyrhizobium sp. SZCCHNR1093]
MNQLAEQLGAAIAFVEKNEATMEARMKELEAQGYRIVSGGHVIEDVYEITDQRTDKVIWRGEGYEGYEAAWKDNYYSYDRLIEDHLDVDYPNPTDIPHDIAEAIQEWVEMNMEEAKTWLASMRS